MTAAEAAHRLGLSEQEVAQLAARGELPALWIGGEVLRFHPDDLAAWRPPASGQADPAAPRGPVATIQEAPARPADPVSRGKGDVTTVSSQPVPAPRTWQDRCLEFIYTYDGYVVSALLVATILVALFVAPR